MRYISYGDTDIELSISDDISSPRIIKEIETGSYESREMMFAQRFVSKGDRVLELGSGLGLISTAVGKTMKPEYYAAVEADPRLIPHIKRTHQKNGVEGSDVIQAAFVADPETLTLGHVDFGVTKAFWGSAISKAGSENVTTVRVDVEDASKFVRDNGINFLILDIEGGELDLFRHLDFGGIEKMIVETHPRVFGQAGMREIFQILDRKDFVYNAPNSAGPVVSFQKIA